MYFLISISISVSVSISISIIFLLLFLKTICFFAFVQKAGLNLAVSTSYFYLFSLGGTFAAICGGTSS